MIVTTVERCADGTSWEEPRDAAKPPTYSAQNSPSKQRIIWPKMSVGLWLRNPALEDHPEFELQFRHDQHRDAWQPTHKIRVILPTSVLSHLIRAYPKA